MRPASRIQAVIEIYEKIGPAKIPMDAIVGDYMRQRRYIGAKDRADIADRAYRVMRAWGRLTWWMGRVEAEPTARNLLILNTILAEGASENKMKDFFDGSKFAPEELSTDEIALYERLKGKSLDDPDMPESVRVECPEEYEEALRGYFGDDFAGELTAMQHSATLDMRANVFVAPRDKVKASLEKDGVVTDETPYSPWGLRARDKAYLSKTKAFAKGLVEIQDEGSQMIAHVCNAQPGNQVLDFCAGGGGKTLALAAAMNRKGRIVAMDNDERRLQKGKERFRKAQIADIVEVRPMSDERHRKWLRRQKETFDIVLLDVPCSGTGTWRRNPDKRWKIYGPGLDELLKTQSDILEKASGCVKPGGKLVYATCSLLPSENENQVEAFLVRHPEFSVKPVDAKLGAPYMRLTPLRHNTDGFFAAVLEKK